ncbi:MAG: DUF3341 domain-containing protein [Bdellovibrionaceae bacterium]|nr:DUF3341 domain-containing protein [Bdellovibrio sp.]
MEKNNKAVFGIFKTRGEVESAVTMLKSNGFRTSDVSCLLPEEGYAQDLVTTKSTKAPEGAATGAGTGVVIGGALGLLVGIGAIAIPGIGPFIAAGPIMAALAGMGVGGTVGVVSGALIGYGIPEYEAKRYEGFVKDGGILLSVHVDDSAWAAKAKNILETTGAKDIATSNELESDWEAFTPRYKAIDDGRDRTF